MGQAVFVVYYGLRFPITSAEDIARLEDEEDDRVRRAAQARLSWYWGNFGAGDIDDCCLFIGTELGIFHNGGTWTNTLSDHQVSTIMQRTKESLQAASFAGAPQLFLYFQPDRDRPPISP